MQPTTLQEAIIYFSNYANCHDAVMGIRWPDVRCIGRAVLTLVRWRSPNCVDASRTRHGVDRWLVRRVSVAEPLNT